MTEQRNPEHVWRRIAQGGTELWRLFAYGEDVPYDESQAFPPPSAHALAPRLESIATATPQKPQPRQLQAAPPQYVVDHTIPDVPLLDNPAIGGRVTVCVLCYGNYHQLHRRCLESIITTLPKHRLDLRVGANQVCQETLDYLALLPITKTYIHRENRRKYPVMREMFHDSEQPITSNYMFWFDDDTVILRPHMWTRAAELIVENRNNQVGAFGGPLYHELRDSRSAAWFREAKWFQGRPFCNQLRQETPNGNCIFFPTGWFWIMSMHAVRTADIPDARILNNGDIALGEQLHQNGFKLKEFNAKKEYVYTAKNNRRGVTDPFPWQVPPYGGA